MTEISRRNFLRYGAVAAGGALALSHGRGLTQLAVRTADSSSDAPFTYDLWNIDTNATVALFQKMVASYNKTAAAKVNFKVTSIPGSGATVYPSKIQSLISSGNPPDLFFDWVGTLASPFVDEGAVQPLTPWVKQYGWDKILAPAAIDYVTFKGAVYELPFGVVTLPVWYNKKLFAKAGAQVPTTYAEWETANNALVKAGITPAAEAVIDGWDIMRLYEQLLEMTAGPTLHDALLNRTASWNSPAVVESFALFQEWGAKWVEKGALGTNPSDTQLLFTGAKAAQSIQGPWYSGLLLPGTSQDFDMFVPPAEHGPATRLGGFAQGWMVGSHVTGSKLDALGEFFNWFIQPQSQRKYYDVYSQTATIGGVPTNLGPLPAKSLEISEKYGAYLIMDEALGSSVIDKYFIVQDGILNGSMTPKQAALKMSSFLPVK
jgi:raffinose/stachyose/melibiose transport system substrate-binding protein